MPKAKGPVMSGDQIISVAKQYTKNTVRSHKSKPPPFTWTPECQLAIERLITELTTAPALAYADFSKPFILHTDASITWLGAALYQLQDGQERVVAYASRGLSKRWGLQFHPITY